MKQRHVIVVGGGASGLVAAITAAKEGASVTVIEQKDRLGKKILSTGNGKCNLTNEYMNMDCFRSDDMSLVSSIISKFGFKETKGFFEELGLLLKSRQGYIYPVSDQAAAVADILSMEVKSLKILVYLKEKVEDITKKSDGFLVKTNCRSVKGDAVVIAAGGKAASVLGSDGSGYVLCKKFGHHLSPVVPALVQLKGKGSLFKQIAGVRTQAKVSAMINGCCVASDTGELQLTNYGISGIPVFQISRFISKALYAKQKAVVEIDYLPSMTDDQFLELLVKRMKMHGERSAAEYLVGIFPQKLIDLFLKISRISANQRADEITSDQLSLLVKIVKHFFVDIDGVNDFEQAQICAGGVLTSEVDKETLESIYMKNLYITGELLDVDGICGGYNLQWAWATGYIAGKNAAKG